MSDAQNLTWKHILNRLTAQNDLSRAEVSWAMNELMEGKTPESIIGAFLIGLHVKGETSEELAALAEGMINKAEKISVTRDAVDIVGTGGDQQNTVNISTMASLVVAGAGIPVVKHGNRASSSTTGSADVLEKLNVGLGMNINDVAQATEEVGITFLFAQVFHPAMKHVAPVRRTLGVPTAFNYLGPLTNPAQVRFSAVGVTNTKMAELIAQVFASRGNHALILRGSDGLDEITITGTSDIWEANDEGVKHLNLNPEDYGFPLGTLDDLRGGDAEHNALIARETLAGKEGTILNAVLLNAAAGITAYRPIENRSFEERFADALAVAKASVSEGRALETLDRWVEFSSTR